MNTEIMKKLDRALRLYVDECHDGVGARAAKQLGISPGLLNKWLKPEGDKDKREPSLTKLGPLLEELKIKIVFSWEVENKNGDCKRCEELEQKLLRLEIKNEALMEVINNLKNPAEKLSSEADKSPVGAKDERISLCLLQDDKMAI